MESRSNPRRRFRYSLSAARLGAVEQRVARLGGERELRLVGVGHARHRRGRLDGGDVAHRGQALRPGGEEVAEDRAARGDAVHVDRRLGDDPQAPLAAQHHLAHARARRRAGHRADDQRAGRRHDAKPARQVGHVAVLVGLHPRGARGDPAAERRVGEAVREVPERPAARVQLLLELRAEHAGLHAREARRVVDLEHPVHGAEVERDDRAVLVRAALRGCRRCSCLRRTGSRRRRRRARRAAARRPRPRPAGGRRRRAAGRGRRRASGGGRAGSCRGAWTTRSSAIGRDAARADGRLQRVAELRAQRRLGDREVVERDGRGIAPARTSTPRWRSRKGREGGLVVMIERDVLASPAPPLHRSHSGPSSRFAGSRRPPAPKGPGVSDNTGCMAAAVGTMAVAMAPRRAARAPHAPEVPSVLERVEIAELSHDARYERGRARRR